MKIPRLLFGKATEVSRRLRPLVSSVLKGATLPELDFGELMDTRDEPASFILLKDQSVPNAAAPFRCHAFLYELYRARTAKRGKGDEPEQAFIWSLEQPWSFAGTCGEAGIPFFFKADPKNFPHAKPEALTGRPEYWLPFLLAADRFWLELESEGPRFEPIVTGGHPFSMCASTLIRVLSYVGMPMDPNPYKVPGVTRDLLTRALRSLTGPN